MFLRSIAILVASLLIAGLVNALHPNKIPWIQDWDGYVETKAREAGVQVVSWSFAQERFEEKSALFVDARSYDEFSSGHIPNAVSLPFEQLDDSFEIFVELVESNNGRDRD